MLRHLIRRKIDFFLERILQPRCPPDKWTGHVLQRYVEWEWIARRFLRRLLTGRLVDAGRVLVDSLWDWITDHEWRSYQQWVAANQPSQSELNAQRLATLDADGPIFTIIVSNCDTNGRDWSNTLRSLQRQSYPHWIARRLPHTANAVAQLNSALRMATGEFIAFIHAGDIVAPHALYEMAERVSRQPDVDVIYTDEDRMRGSRHVAPHFKPAWSPERLLTTNYLGGLALMRTRLAIELGGFRTEAEGAHQWDLMLRLSERTDHVAHIDKVLFHCPESRNTLIDSELGKQVVSDHLKRRGANTSATDAPRGGLRLHLPTVHRPLVSVIIPNRNQTRLLKMCVSGLLQRTEYKPLEIIIVDNGSTEPNLHHYYDRLQCDELATVVPFDEPFNYSRACNLGAKSAQGELLLFLNNDIEVLHPDWLEELAACALQPRTGVVGAKLLYPNRSIQHGGMILDGAQREPTHVFRFRQENSKSIFGSTEVYRNFLAVTGACQMFRREVFDAVGGYDEGYTLCCSDMAICIEAIHRGLRVVYTPHARLIHHESASRGNTNPFEVADWDRFSRLLDERRITTDPYFHPALTVGKFPPDFRLRADAA